MTDKISDNDRKALIDYRLQKAYDALKEADILRKSNFHSTAISRLYYAVFYAASALMLNENIQAATHAGIKQMLGLHFISKGRIDHKTGKLFQTLFEKRHSNDYDDFIFTTDEEVAQLQPEAKNFVDTIAALINNV